MMRKIWVKADPWDKELVLTALESGADGIMVPDGCSEKIKELGRVTTICADGDLVPGKDVEIFTITSGDDEEAICRLAAQKLVILECTDWTIIPLENLIAKGADVAALVHSFDEAQLAFGILEKGVKQVMLDTRDPGELKKTLELLKGEAGSLSLVEAEVIDVKNIGMGDRVCVDTCRNMEKGQGMLVGNSSSALFLVHAETVSNPYVAPRPFRINAGAVHAYTRVPGGRTRYLSELEAGDEVEIVNHDGSVSSAVVGRLKIEKRPMLLIKARIGDKGVATIVQNAETIRLTSPEGEPVSVVSLAPGDRVLAYHEEGGRHFGHKVDETITEK
ncbi:3-dehydroquinate synthase II [Desulfoluna butyratoxydans]|uniref:3-dehydroquinate synthase n=1 Tax=Desulfoluna butyratoxydans TaxID=231438 RepID=A0A4U8YUE2_9BACT|nr:3-dehydroquinate synthase II [Desulfoluna butyratoxydans]VFQ44953.1 3-dehydroquinate synthase [Desulfoluna butyratoxydans]